MFIYKYLWVKWVHIHTKKRIKACCTFLNVVTYKHKSCKQLSLSSLSFHKPPPSPSNSLIHTLLITHIQTQANASLTFSRLSIVNACVCMWISAVCVGFGCKHFIRLYTTKSGEWGYTSLVISFVTPRNINRRPCKI